MPTADSSHRGLEQYNPYVAQFLWYAQRARATGLATNVLDCAAGGAHPPLALFAAQGFETCGVDISREQVDRAWTWSQRTGVPLNISLGDMRELPLEDDTFGFVYEWHSMCHLPRRGIEKAVSEMARVVQPRGYVYTEFMLNSTWPMEPPPTEESDASSGQATHTYFARDAVTVLLRRNGLDPVWSQERMTRYPSLVRGLSLEEWMVWRVDFPGELEDTWRDAYPARADRHVTVELAVICRKASGEDPSTVAGPLNQGENP